MITWDQDPWAYFDNYFNYICEDVSRLRLETKEEALAGTYLAEDPEVGPGFMYKHECVVPFRKGDNPQELAEQLAMAQSLIPKVRAALDARELTLDFLAQWGRLTYATGFVRASWFARDYDELTSERAGRKSGAKRGKDLERRFVAKRLIPLLDAGMTRKEAEQILVTELLKTIEAGAEIPPLSLAQMQGLFTGKMLKTTYREQKLTQDDLKKLARD